MCFLDLDRVPNPSLLQSAQYGVNPPHDLAVGVLVAIGWTGDRRDSVEFTVNGFGFQSKGLGFALLVWILA